MADTRGASARAPSLLRLGLVCAALSGCAHTPIASLERLQIGDSVERVQRVLHSRVEPVPSTSSVEHDATAINLPERGIRVFFTAGSTYVIRFDAPFGGDIDGLRIGETRQALLARRGSPTRTLAPHMRTAPNVPDPYLYRLPDGTTLRADFDAGERIVTIFVTAGAVQFAEPAARSQALITR